MESALSLFITALATFLASGAGFWQYLRTRDETKKATTRLLMGVAHEKIVHLGLEYIERGWVTLDEIEDFKKYLFEPYFELGGNGTAERVMHGLERLPLRTGKLVSIPIRSTDPTATEEDTSHATTYTGPERRRISESRPSIKQ